MAERDAPFTRMAEEIGKNATERFGGAFVIVPPAGDPVEFLILDPAADSVIFWSTLQTKAQIALEEAQERENQQSGAYRGR